MRTEALLLAALALGACKKEEAAPATPPAAPPVVKTEAVVAPDEPENVWQVEFTTEPPLTAGKEATATITIATVKGYHVNAEYPLSFKPTPTEAAAYAGERVSLKAASQTLCEGQKEDACEVKVPLAITAVKPGVVAFEGVLSFSVCSADKCLTPKENLRLVVDVL